MNVHRALDDRVRGFGIHQIEDRVDRLVASRTEQRGAEDLFAVAIDENAHKALRLALFDGTGNARHRPLAGQHAPPAVARLGQGHADAAQWRVGVKGIGGDALADPARILVEQIRGDDLEIVVRGVGEGALAIAVPESPDAGRRGLQSVIDDDVATLVAAHPGFVEIQIVGIRPAADCQQQMRAGDFGGAGGAIDLGDDLVAAPGEADAFGIQPDVDALALDDVLDRRRQILVLMANQPRRHFDDRYLAAKAAVHLAEFKADIAAADNDEMVRRKIDVHHRRIRQVGYFVYAGHWRHQRPAADIDKDPFGAQPLAAHFHYLRRSEPGVAAV